MIQGVFYWSLTYGSYGSVFEHVLLNALLFLIHILHYSIITFVNWLQFCLMMLCTSMWFLALSKKRLLTQPPLLLLVCVHMYSHACVCMNVCVCLRIAGPWRLAWQSWISCKNILQHHLILSMCITCWHEYVHEYCACYEQRCNGYLKGM